MRSMLAANPLYKATLDWMHYQEKLAPNKTEVANYWHDYHATATSGATNDALSHSAVFLMRMVGVAELGKFIAAGTGRETHLEMDPTKLAEFATGAASAPMPEPVAAAAQPPTEATPPDQPVAPPAGVTMGAGLNVNLEIHIAADAKPATVEEIFKNMRKYLIDGPETSAGGG